MYTHLSQCWQYNSQVKTTSSGLVLTFPLHQMQQYYFTADTSRALRKVEKTGIPKGLVGPSELRGIQGTGKLLVALLTAQSSQRNTFWVWLVLS